MSAGEPLLSLLISNIDVLMRIACAVCCLQGLWGVMWRQSEIYCESIRDIIGSIMLLVTNPLFARPDKWTNWF